MGDELVELGLPNQILEVEQEVEALFVWDAGECIIGILALEIDDELGKFVVGAKVIDRVRQCLPPDNGRKVSVFFTVPANFSKRNHGVFRQSALTVQPKSAIASAGKTPNNDNNRDGNTYSSFKVDRPSLVQPEMFP